jgi:hypothetical protein
MADGCRAVWTSSSGAITPRIHGDDLVAAANPTAQAKSTGTTTSDSITFASPTGGSGSYTASSVVAHIAGSGTALSQADQGPLTVTSLEDGDVVKVTCTWTDDLDGQVVANTIVVTVAAAAGSDEDLTFTVVDLTDGWTLNDPDSLINANTFAGGYNTITWNALGSGSQNYNPGSGSTIRAPRWYKLLKIAATQLTSDDLVLYRARLQNDETVDDFEQSICLGVCTDPTSVATNTIEGLGGNYNANTSANPKYGVWATNGVTSGASASAVYGEATIASGGRHQGGGVYQVLDTDGLRVQSGSRNGNEAWSTGVNLYEVAFFGTNGAVTIGAGEQSKIKLSRRVLTFVAPS